MAKSLPVTDSPIKQYRNWYYWQKQNRSSASSNLRKIHAFDTETRDGDIFLIANSDGEYLDKITPESVIDFLFRRKFEKCWNFFYNLAYDAEVILKVLGDNLLTYNDEKKSVFFYNDYKFTYYPKKSLAIRKGNHSVVFFDIAQFYNMQSLANAYQSNIGPLPESYLQMKNTRGHFSKTYYRKNTNRIRQYCIQDCKLTQKLSEYFIDLFFRFFKFYPRRWVSSGYIAEKVLINNGVTFPLLQELPESVANFAWNSYFGGRFEMMQRGFIGKAHIYDINSAYPYAISQLPDLTEGDWYRGDEIVPNATVGFFKISVDIDDMKIVCPFPFRKNNSIVYPSGKFVTHCTLQELQVIDDVSYVILDSVQFVPHTKKKPYKKFINNLYNKRLELKRNNDPMQLPIKIILNSIYGKTGQITNNRVGGMFNPVIFAYITGFTRAMLYQFMKKHQLENHIVAFATDSICTTKKLNVNSQKLGGFSFEASGDDCYFLQNGFYRINGSWKNRGIGRYKGKEIEHLDTIQRDDNLFLIYEELRVGRLISSIVSKNLQNIGKFSKKEKKINLNADHKRFWLDRLEEIDTKKNKSMPLSMNYFNKSDI
jgi:hypothetical protein